MDGFNFLIGGVILIFKYLFEIILGGCGILWVMYWWLLVYLLVLDGYFREF